jgi:hypothetical protein
LDTETEAEEEEEAHMAAYSPLSDSFNPHLLSSPIAPKTSTYIHTPVETSRLSQSSNTNTKRNPGGRGARVGSPGGSRVLGGIQVSTTELLSKEGSEQSKCLAASVVVVGLSISLRTGKTLSQIAAAAASSSSEKDKTQTSSKLQTRPRIIKHTEELTPPKKSNNQSFAASIGFLKFCLQGKTLSNCCCCYFFFFFFVFFFFCC